MATSQRKKRLAKTFLNTSQNQIINNAVKGLAQGLVKNLELTFVAKNGREYSAEVSGNVVVDALGKPACFMAITRYY